MQFRKLALIVALGLAIAAFFAFDLGHYLNLQTLKDQQAAIRAFHAESPFLSSAAYFVALRAGHRPVAARRGAADAGRRRGIRPVLGHADRLLRLDARRDAGLPGVALPAARLGAAALRRAAGAPSTPASRAKAAFYLFTLRLVPVFPFFVINLLLGLTAMKARTFYWVSQLGMLAGTVVYVNAGTQLAKIESLSGILSPGLLGSFALLGIFPLIARKIVEVIASQQGLSPAGRSRRASTATWSSSAAAAPGW